MFYDFIIKADVPESNRRIVVPWQNIQDVHGKSTKNPLKSLISIIYF